jgi:hypothetical protein
MTQTREAITDRITDLRRDRGAATLAGNDLGSQDDCSSASVQRNVEPELSPIGVKIASA